MVNIDGEIVIDRPVEEVFDLVADERNEPRYNPRLLWVEKISSGPIGRGTRFRAATKAMARPVEMTIEFTDYQRPRRLGSSTHMPTMEIRGTLAFDPVPEGTRMRWSWGLQPRGVLRLLTPLVARVGKRQEATIWAGLKKFMEAPEQATASPALERATGGGRPLPLKERVRMRLEHEVDTRFVGLATILIRLTKGRMAKLWRRRVLLLTTHGRKSGRERTVPLQFFPDGEDMVVVAANSGLPKPPGWYFNLTADPSARVEVGGRVLQVRAEEMPPEEAAAFWPRVLRIAPDYARYPRRTGRSIPLIRLVPTAPTGQVTAARSSRRAGRRPKEIAPGVYWLRTGRGITGSNVYFVRSGPSWALIDTAWANRGRSIEEAAESLFGAGAPPAAILLTHIHADHSGSATELARRWGCPVYVHPDEAPFAAPGDLSTIERYANPLDRRVILPLLRVMPRRRMESMLSETSLQDVTRAFDPGADLPGLPDWECISTPGHTPGHVSFFRGSDHVLIAGDAVSTVDLNSLRDFVLHKQKVSGPPYISTWDWRAAKESVAVLARLGPRVIAGGHGEPMAGPDAARNLRTFAARFSGVAKRGGKLLGG